MRIENLTSAQNGEVARVSATVIWEDCDRPSQEVYFETPKAFADHLSCNPHAFLVAGAIPAMRWGEKRIAISEPICPELREGLMTAMAWLAHWYDPSRALVQIEAAPGVRAPLLRPERAASFLSGGVDSLASLRTNRTTFPLDHPRSIRDCLFVHGFDMGARKESGTELDIYERALGLLAEIAEEALAVLIPVFTNVRHLDPDVNFWIYEFHGAALASVAHAFSTRLSTVFVASTYDLPNLQAWGCHPLLDSNYSSTELQIRHDGLRFSRLAKVRMIANWDIAVRNLRVCTMNPPDRLNCGVCEKCVRTMTEFLAIDKLDRVQSFRSKDVSKELLSTIAITDPYEDSCFRELIIPLSVRGRHDLVGVIEEKSSEFRKHRAWAEENDWKGAVKRFDRRYLNASLFRTYKAARDYARR